jgi:hypothetical protein
MRLRAVLVLAVVSCALAWAGGTASPAAAATCTHRVSVTFIVYSAMPLPKGNGCWPSERVVQAGWHICHYDGTTRGADPVKWVYDDTSPAHTLSLERARIVGCGAGRSYGYEYMARRNGAWRKLNPGGVVDRFYAELYSSEFTVDDLFGIWSRNRGIGRPTINIGHATNARTRSAVARVCNAVASRSYISIYSSRPVTPQNGKLTAVVAALNACTTR